MRTKPLHRSQAAGEEKKQMLLRLYKMDPGPMPVALLALAGGRLGVERLFQRDPLVDAITGAVSADLPTVLRAALEGGRFLITRHDPDDTFFREAEVLSADQIVRLVKKGAAPAAPGDRPGRP